MIPLTASTAGSTSTPSLWMVSIYAGLVTAVITVVTTLLFKWELPILYIPAFLLIGAGPILGYQIATGQPGRDWKSIIGGVLGFLLLPLAFLLWPILVGALSATQSIGKLLLASILGFVLGVTVFLALGALIGQNPAWASTGLTLLCATWGGTCGAAMIAWRNDAVEETPVAVPA